MKSTKWIAQKLVQILSEIEKLENTIHDYIEYRYKANVEIQTILNNSLSENGLSKCEIINIGQVLSSDILENKKNDFNA